MLQYAVVGLLLHDIYRLYQLPDASASRFAAPPVAPTSPAAAPDAAAAAAAAATSPTKREEKTKEA